MSQPDRLSDKVWMEVLAEMRRRHSEGADVFVVRTKDGRPQVYTADERSSHTTHSDS